jgi:hypothetical protein
VQTLKIQVEEFTNDYEDEFFGYLIENETKITGKAVQGIDLHPDLFRYQTLSYLGCFIFLYF